MRLLPWFQEDVHRDPAGTGALNNCDECKARYAATQRQGMACGYEPAPSVDISVMPWQPPIGEHGYQEAPPTVCAGYTTKLPEVIEAARARFHWAKGAVRSFCQGEQPTEILLLEIELLETSANQLQHWFVVPMSKGGGGPG